MTTSTPWRPIILLWLTGVIAAAALGKFASLTPLIVADLHVSRVQAGWLVSLIEAGGASSGIIAGQLIARTGSRRALTLGMALLAIGGAAGAGLPGIAPLFIARLVEACGYLMCVIAAPSLIAHLARPQDQGTALSLWSTFVPAGFAISMSVSGVIAPWLGWRAPLWLWAALAAAAAIAASRVPASPSSPSRLGMARFVLPPLAVWLMCAGFGAFALVFTGLIAMFPLFLTGQGQGAAVAAAVTAAASAATMAGAWGAAQALKRGTATRWAALSAGLLVPAVLACIVFSGRDAGVVSVLFIALAALFGVASSLFFARLPHMDAHLNVAAANGVLTQFGAGGSLIGPPLLAAVTDHWGWAALGPAALTASALSLGLAFAAERVARR